MYIRYTKKRNLFSDFKDLDQEIRNMHVKTLSVFKIQDSCKMLVGAISAEEIQKGKVSF